MEKPNWALTTQAKEANKDRNALVQMNSLLENRKEELTAALKGVMTPEYFRRVVMTALTSNPKLASCTMASIYESALNSAQLGLEPNTPLQEAYLIPYGKNCSFQVGRNGWIKLAHRTGLVKYCNALPVYEGEEFMWQPGKDPEVLHIPDIEIADDARLITAYAFVVLNDGTKIYEVLRARDWKKIRASAKGDGPGWKKWPERMICRSALKRLIRTRLPVNEFFITKDLSAEPKPVPEVVIDEATGEILSPEQKRVSSIIDAQLVPQEDGGGVQQDGAEQPPPTSDDAESNTKLTAAQFWSELDILCDFWKQEPAGPSGNRRANIKKLIQEEYGENATLAKLDSESRHNLLNRIEKSFKDKQLLKEDDDAAY
tara:strand:- start:506 stop:1621 length:1116 start_codon:yes stop_codon:yes gene_type:complete